MECTRTNAEMKRIKIQVNNRSFTTYNYHNIISCPYVNFIIRHICTLEKKRKYFTRVIVSCVYLVAFKFWNFDVFFCTAGAERIQCFWGSAKNWNFKYWLLPLLTYIIRKLGMRGIEYSWLIDNISKLTWSFFGSNFIITYALMYY